MYSKLLKTLHTAYSLLLPPPAYSLLLTAYFFKRCLLPTFFLRLILFSTKHLIKKCIFI